MWGRRASCDGGSEGDGGRCGCGEEAGKGGDREGPLFASCFFLSAQRNMDYFFWVQRWPESFPWAKCASIFPTRPLRSAFRGWRTYTIGPPTLGISRRANVSTPQPRIYQRTRAQHIIPSFQILQQLLEESHEDHGKGDNARNE